MAELEGQTTVEDQIAYQERTERREALKQTLLPLWADARYDYLPHEGWDQLIQELIDDAFFLQVAGAIQIQQIKEKFGTLRFYYSYDKELADPKALDLFRKLVSYTEIRTGYVCEECGKRGEMRSQGWYKVRCDNCQEVFENVKRR